MHRPGCAAVFPVRDNAGHDFRIVDAEYKPASVVLFCNLRAAVMEIDIGEISFNVTVRNDGDDDAFFFAACLSSGSNSGKSSFQISRRILFPADDIQAFTLSIISLRPVMFQIFSRSFAVRSNFSKYFSACSKVSSAFSRRF